jgi:hypothetical protein
VLEWSSNILISRNRAQKEEDSARKADAAGDEHHHIPEKLCVFSDVAQTFSRQYHAGQKKIRRCIHQGESKSTSVFPFSIIASSIGTQPVLRACEAKARVKVPFGSSAAASRITASDVKINPREKLVVS